MSEAELAALESLSTLVLTELDCVTLVNLDARDVARFGELLRATIQTLRAVRSASLRPSSPEGSSNG